MHELANKTALITGASRGIGAATAIEMAQLGMSVALLARNAKDLAAVVDEISEQGGKAVAIQGDVTRYADVQLAVQTCMTEFGSLDVLVNNAGLIEPITRLADSDPDAWKQVMDVNVMGVYHGLRAVIPVMQKQQRGVIVNISSGAATGVLEGWSHYCASKAAVLSLTRCTHLEYHEQGIRVLGMSPGTVATHMQVAIKASGINRVSELEHSDHIPPGWAARAVVWLCTDAASEFAGTDFSIKTAEHRALVGLPAPAK